MGEQVPVAERLMETAIQCGGVLRRKRVGKRRRW
ncbi:hypothetical protein L195_g062382, partial [Trifolium pratense]